MKNDYNTNLKKWKKKVKSNSTLIIGIDVSRASHDACFGNRDRVFKKKFKFDNNREGYCKLNDQIKLIINKYKIKNVIFGLEPTGYYWFPLSAYLKKNNKTVCLLSPKAVCNNRKTRSEDEGKTDPKDAFAIYDLMGQSKFFFSASASEKQLCAKLYMKNWMSVQKSLIRSKNRMRSFLNLMFPEYEIVIDDIGSSTVLNFLEDYPIPASILRHKKNEFINLKIRRMSKEKLLDIYQLAKNTIGISTYNDNGSYIIQELVADLKGLIKRESLWFQKCKGFVSDTEGFELLTEIKGLGDKIVTGLLISYADFSNFVNAKQITKLAGLSLIQKESGTSVKKLAKISKQGSHTLRYWAYHGAINVIKHDGPFKELYEKKKKSSPGKGSGKRALIAVSDKLIRVTWTMLKRGDSYKIDFDKEVRKKYK